MRPMGSWQMGTRRTNSIAIGNTLTIQSPKPSSKSLGAQKDTMIASYCSSTQNIQHRCLAQSLPCTLLCTLLPTILCRTRLWYVRDSMRMALPVGTHSCLVQLNSSGSSNSDSRINPNRALNTEAKSLHRIHQGNTLQTSATLGMSLIATPIIFINAVIFKLEYASSAINASFPIRKL